MWKAEAGDASTSSKYVTPPVGRVHVTDKNTKRTDQSIKRRLNELNV